MYYYLISSLKRRLILELQDSFAQHPVYRKITPYIQNRFAFTERPQYGIVVKGSSANKLQLDAANFVGTVQSHVMLAYVNQPTFPLEWIREDLACVKANDDVFPTAPGVYYLEVLTAPTMPNEPGTFALDPLLTVTDEAVLIFQSGIEREGQLQQVPSQNTLRLWENHNQPLIEGHDFTADYTTGAIEFIRAFGPDAVVTADYRYAADSLGPVPFYWNQANTSILPGVVLAFGKRAEVGQKVAIVVYGDRVDAAHAYGGKYEASFDLEVIARDTTQMEEMADLVVMYLWGQKRDLLAWEGIEIQDVSWGGEAEEPADETGDNYFYTASLSVTFQADWEIHVPLPLTISRATPQTQQGDTDPTAPSGLQQVGTGNLFFATHPVVAGRNDNFERIG